MSIWSEIKEDVVCVFKRDPAARHTVEVILTYPGVHAILSHRVSHRLWKRGWKFVPRILSYFTRMVTNIDIHPGATIGKRFFIDHGAGVVIGETAEVGDDVTLYHGVTLGGTSWNKGKRHPTLKDHVVVGAGAKILGPITVGCSAKIGANSVVVKNVPHNSTVVGIPGSVVRNSKFAAANLNGIDLDHHLIPDPVAEAIARLAARVCALENELSIAENKVGKTETESASSDDLNIIRHPGVKAQLFEKTTLVK